MTSYLKKFLVKYNSFSAPVKASLWFTICNVVQKGITLLSTPIFTRLLTTEQYGVYTIYQSWYQIISIFATLNLVAGVYNNGLMKYENKKDEFTSAMQGLSTTITMILFMVYLCGRKYWNELFELSTLFVCMMFLELLFVPAYNFWSTRERFSYRYKKLIFTTIIIALGSPIIGVISVLNTMYKAEARVLSYVLVQVIIGIYFYIRNAIRGKAFFKRDIWKFALRFNIPLIPHYLAFQILNQSDRIMIGKMVGSSEAAIYSVAYSVSMMMTIITNAINNSFIPYTYKAIKDKKYGLIRTNANMLLVLVGGGCVLAMAFGPEIIKLFASSEYYDAIWVMPPVAASVYFMFLYPLFGNIEFYFEKTTYVTIASCIGAIANIILNYIFIKVCGYYAAGYTTLVCYMLFAFMHYVFYKKIIKQECCNEKIYDVKFILVFSACLLISMIGMTLTYKYLIIRYMIIIALVFLAFINRRKILDGMKKIKAK